jgi:four helix bundle protein
MPARTASRAPVTSAEPTPAAVPAPAPADSPAAPSLSGYRGLKVWQRAMDLAAAVHVVTKTLPADEEALREEMRRAASTIPAQIAAGNSLYQRAEYIEHLSTAHGAAARLECLLQIADRLAALPTRDTSPLVALASEVARMLRGLARALQTPRETEAAVPEAT